MLDLPEPKPTATAAGQDRNAIIDQRADQFLAAINDAAATYYRDDSPTPTVGTAPPVPQPGRPPMSQRATDASALMLSGGIASVFVSGGISLILWSSGHADSTVIAWMSAGPPMAFLSLKALIKGVKRATVPDIHQHNYSGPVTQHHRTSNNRSIWNKNINKP
jgi:hypothetical protein